MRSAYCVITNLHVHALIYTYMYLHGLEHAGSVVPSNRVEVSLEGNERPQAAWRVEVGDDSPGVSLGIVALHCVQQPLTIMAAWRGEGGGGEGEGGRGEGLMGGHSSFFASIGW